MEILNLFDTLERPFTIRYYIPTLLTSTLLEKQFILEKDYKKSLLLQQKQKMTLED